MQYLQIFLLVLLNITKKQSISDELKILHLDRYCIPYFLLKVWYALAGTEINFYRQQPSGPLNITIWQPRCKCRGPGITGEDRKAVQTYQGGKKMLSFLASSAFFKYAQNEGFAFKKFKMFMGGGIPPQHQHVRTALQSSPVIPVPLHLHLGYQIFKLRGPDGYCL